MFSKIKLPNQLPGEKVVKNVRRDMFVLFRKVLFFLLLFVLPAGVLGMSFSFYPSLKTGELSYPLIVLGLSAYYLFVWLFFFFTFIDYYLDVWIVTNRRIINIEQQGFFARRVSEHKLFRIQDVTSEVEGVFPTILKYGSVYIQTAGTKRNFHFEQVPHPDKIKDIIIELVQRDRKRQKLKK